MFDTPELDACQNKVKIRLYESDPHAALSLPYKGPGCLYMDSSSVRLSLAIGNLGPASRYHQGSAF